MEMPSKHWTQAQDTDNKQGVNFLNGLLLENNGLIDHYVQKIDLHDINNNLKTWSPTRAPQYKKLLSSIISSKINSTWI